MMRFNVSPSSKQYRHHIRGDLCGVGLIIIDDLAIASGTPVLDACRQLLQLGYPSDSVLEVFRGGTLSLTVYHIGAAAQLEINGKGDGFVKRRFPVGMAPPIRPHEQAATHPTLTVKTAVRSCAPVIAEAAE